MKTSVLKQKEETFFQKHKYALFFFAFVVLYNFLITNKAQLWQASRSTHTFHLVDFSVGFCTKLLPGAIYQALFGGHASITLTTVYETVLLLLFFAALAVVLEHLLKRVDDADRGIAFFALLLFLSGPCTFAIFVDELGMMDVYWVFFALAFFLCLRSKWARWFIPVLCFLSLLINLSSMIAYIILFFIVMLYKALTAEKKKPWIILFSVSLVVTVGTFLYFLLFESSNLLLTMDEFNQLIESRGGGYTVYYDYSLYGYTFEQDVKTLAAPDSFFGRLFVGVANQILVNFFIIKDFKFDYFAGSFYCLAVILPVVVVIYKKIIGVMKHDESNRQKNIALALMLIQFPFTIVCGALSSVDLARWISHSFLVLFAMFLFLVHEQGSSSFLKINLNYKNPLLYIWAFSYFFTWVAAYSG